MKKYVIQITLCHMHVSLDHFWSLINLIYSWIHPLQQPNNIFTYAKTATCDSSSVNKKQVKGRAVKRSLSKEKLSFLRKMGCVFYCSEQMLLEWNYFFLFRVRNFSVFDVYYTFILLRLAINFHINKLPNFIFILHLYNEQVLCAAIIIKYYYCKYLKMLNLSQKLSSSAS